MFFFSMLSPQINVGKVYLSKHQGRNIDTIGTSKPRAEENFHLEVTIMTISFVKNTCSEMNWKEIEINSHNKNHKSGG